MGMNKWLGWGLSTLALRFLNKSSSSETSSEPENLSITQTKLGNTIPVVMGTCLIKSPLIAYYGDFSSRPYTETYAAHAKFNAWPLVLTLIAQYISTPSTTVQQTPGAVTSTGTGYHGVTVSSSGTSNGATSKDVAVGPLIQSLFMWLLSWLINGRNLKTTIQKGFKYYLGFQEIICWSHPNARLKTVYMNEKKVWEGDEPASNHLDGSPFIIRVDNENLFGGVDENGGFVGDLHLYFGTPAQQPDNWMVQQMNAASIQTGLRGLSPAYRSYMTLVVPTAYVGKNATIPSMWFEIEIVPDSLGLEKINNDANPAEVLYELHTNNRWGLAEPADLLNVESLKEIGRILAKEGVGISAQLAAKTQARTVVDTICEHINAIRYLEQVTGQLNYRLIRDDYEASQITKVTPSNCMDITFARQDWTNTISQLTISYTDRSNLYETGTLSDTDSANIEINNGTKTNKTYEYPYFTTAANAYWAAQRELRQEGYPVATADLTCNRKLSNVRLGDVICLSWPAYGIDNMLMRVTNVDLGDFIAGQVKLSAMEDIFALAKTNFNYSGSTGWNPNPLYPSGVQEFLFMEFPFELLRSYDTYVYGFAVQPDMDTTSWTIWRNGAATDNNFVTTNTMSKWTPAGRIIYDYDEFGDTCDMTGFQLSEISGITDLKKMLSAESNTDMQAARRGGKLIIAGDEIIAYSALTQMPNGHWSVTGVIRGVYDTVPQAHPAGETVYFAQSGHYGNVTTGGPVCTQCSAVKEFYNITTATVNKAEGLDALKNKELNTVRRSERPCVQGNIKMSAHNITNIYHTAKLSGDLRLSWTARNKVEALGCVSQSDTVDFWSGQAYTAPAGLEYVTDVYVNASLVRQSVGMTEQFTYKWADRCNDSLALFAETQIDTYCRLNGLDSYQKQSRIFNWTIPILVNVLPTVADAEAYVWSADNGGQIVVQAGVYNNVIYADYIDCPIVLLGNRLSAMRPGALYNQSGDIFLPNGQAMLFHDVAAYELIKLDAGFVLKTEFRDNTQTSVGYLQWDGIQFNEAVIL